MASICFWSALGSSFPALALTLSAMLVISPLSSAWNIPLQMSDLTLNFFGTSLILMTLALTSLILWAAMTSRSASLANLQSLTLVLALICVMAFSSNNWFWFYLWFEASLWPMALIVLGWGYQPERLKATQSMALYTLLGSLPLLVATISLTKTYSGLHWVTTLNAWTQIMSLMAITGFLVKIPMFGVHLWLPLAHVEAPVSGSMFLAAVLLKLGGFGLFLLTPVLSQNSQSVMFFQSWALIGAMLVSVLCIFQSDMKTLIAYSSVAHMGMVIAAMLMQAQASLKAALLLMVAHGVSSAFMFSNAAIIYFRTSSRNLGHQKALLALTPGFSLLVFLGACANMGAPPLLNFVAEVISIIALMPLSLWLAIPMGILLFTAAAYSLVFYMATNHSSSRLQSPAPLTLAEHSTWMAHVLFLFTFFIIIV